MGGRDSEDTEYFPLSGGIDNGVQVSIKVKMQTAATIEFLTNARAPAFRFVVDGHNPWRVLRKPPSCSPRGQPTLLSRLAVSGSLGMTSRMPPRRQLPMCLSTTRMIWSR